MEIDLLTLYVPNENVDTGDLPQPYGVVEGT